jgi:hypothetical protein
MPLEGPLAAPSDVRELLPDLRLDDDGKLMLPPPGPQRWTALWRGFVEVLSHVDQDT